ncbi:exodeoxyribonuclease VII small subunit [Aeoliella mucimassa]|uniref:Exodeoxyribonuclease 7 small subunit n=1 Tax=Aeoliella mucimassa TaxID=2527972 RepID=A0A518AKG0_9BACT|nr:exodeoxyribonuclease VII small subunit [Aeoliella mucimassa]QDU55219.1 Exodeoxyribonuclease 7 small subunit [Aeoliella mucimassa]
MAKKKVKRKPSEESTLTFEESLAELETIVGDLETGELGLGDALERYEQGIAHLKQCHAQLEQATRRIELLSGVDAAGNPVTVPFEDEQHESLEAKKQARTRRRGGGGDDHGTLF